MAACTSDATRLHRFRRLGSLSGADCWRAGNGSRVSSELVPYLDLHLVVQLLLLHCSVRSSTRCLHQQRNSLSERTCLNSGGREAITTNQAPNNRTHRPARTPSHDSTTPLGMATYHYALERGQTRTRRILRCRDGRGTSTCVLCCGVSPGQDADAQVGYGRCVG